MPSWIEDLRYSVEIFSEAGTLEQVLGRLHDWRRPAPPMRLQSRSILAGSWCCAGRRRFWSAAIGRNDAAGMPPLGTIVDRFARRSTIAPGGRRQPALVSLWFAGRPVRSRSQP